MCARSREWIAATVQVMRELAGADDDANFGPIDWRGEPVLHTPDYDAAKWDTVWKDW